MLKRLREWWTRPSWESYLAEFDEAVKQNGLADEATDKLKVCKSLLCVAIQEIVSLQSMLDSVTDIAEHMVGSRPLYECDLEIIRNARAYLNKDS